jgi:hypothetical protein
MAPTGERDQSVSGCQNFHNHPVGGVEIIRAK